MVTASLQKFAVLFPSGLEYSSRLMTGINQFLDGHPTLELVELPFKDGVEDPLEHCRWNFEGAILWADRNNPWVARLPEQGIPTVNCCRDWQGHPGIVSLSLDQNALCDEIMRHFQLLQPRQIAAVGVDFERRPHSEAICARVLQLAKDAGYPTSMLVLQGLHPDTHRSRITDLDHEPELLQFLDKLQKPCAIWAENDHVARMICNAADYLKLRIPNQVAVLGSGDYRISTVDQPRISTIPRRAEEIGEMAIKTLYDWFPRRQAQPADKALAPSPVVVRETTQTSDPISLKMTTARRLIEAEACRGITVESLCQHLDISKMTLTTHFTELYGISPGAHIRDIKTQEVKRLLRASQQPLGEIALIAGFSDQSKFSKFFKRQTGMTPSEFRQLTED